MKEQEAFIPTMLALDRRRVAGGEKPRRIHGIFLVCAVLLFSLGLTACSSSGVASNEGQPSTPGLGNSLSSYATTDQVEAAVRAARNPNAFPKNLEPPIQTLISGNVNGPQYPADWTHHCGGSEGAAVQSIPKCTGGDKESKTVVALIGDSRAGMWSGTFDNLGYLMHFKVVHIYKAGCPAPLANYVPSGEPEGSTWVACNEFHKGMIHALDVLKPKVIVIASETLLDLANPPHNAEATPAQTQADLEKLIKALPSASKAVVLSGFPTPGYSTEPTMCLSKAPRSPSDCNFTPSPVVTASNQAFENAASQTGAGYIDEGPWFCASVCPPIIASTIVYTIDGWHSDGWYLNYLTRALWAALKPYLG